MLRIIGLKEKLSETQNCFGNTLQFRCVQVKDLTAYSVGAQAANELLNIIGVKASFVLTDYRNTIYISARSIDEINVQIVMERLGGGGHLNIAGAQLEHYSITEAKDVLKQTLQKMLDEGDI